MKNYEKMASIAAENKAVVIRGTNRVHFEDEVLSWHNVNGENAEEILPAILITNRHPSKFKESINSNNNAQIELDLKMIFIPLKKFCNTTTEMLKIKYAYNERGQKIRKTVYADPNNENFVIITHYLNDLSGNVMAVYTDTRLDNEAPNVQLAEITLYGIGRLGLVYNNTESISPYVYELTDHIGNVRATVLSTKVSGAVEVLSYTDYYPHGSVMPGRHYESSNGYRYDFQGKEKDGELNWNNFELRMYDPNLARWMSPDPYREFHSPYLAMGNDPINRIDPTGGKSSRLGEGSNGPEIDYSGRARPEDPFDMVGGGGWREEKYGWTNGKLISLEDDPYSPYTLSEQIESRIVGSGYAAGTGSTYKNSGVSQYNFTIYESKSSDKVIGTYTAYFDKNENLVGINNIVNVEQKESASSKDALFGIASIMIGGLESSYEYDSKQVSKLGQRVNGKVRSAETISRANRISSTATAKYLGYAGKALGIYGFIQHTDVAISAYQNGEYGDMALNIGKMGVDAFFIINKSVNPILFVASVGYTALDIYTTKP